MYIPQEWSLLNFYKKAFKFTWANKKLWILGMAFVVLGASTNQNFNFSNYRSSNQDQQQEQISESSRSQQSQELEQAEPSQTEQEEDLTLEQKQQLAAMQAAVDQRLEESGQELSEQEMALIQQYLRATVTGSTQEAGDEASGETDNLDPDQLREVKTPEEQLTQEMMTLQTQKGMEALPPQLANFMTPERFEQLSELVKQASVVGQEVVASLGTIAVSTYILLGIEILILVILGLVIGVTATLWAQAVVIKGVYTYMKAAQKDLDKPVDEAKSGISLSSISLDSFKNVTGLLWLSIVPGLKLFAKMVLASIGAAIIYALLTQLNLSTQITNTLGIIAIAGIIIYWIVAVIRLGLTIIWAQRHCVIENISGKLAFQKAKVTIKDYHSKTLWMGIANVLLAGLIGLVAYLPAAVLTLIGVSSYLDRGAGLGIMLTGVLIFLLTVPLVKVIRAATVIFTYSTLQLGFNYLSANKTYEN